MGSGVGTSRSRAIIVGAVVVLGLVTVGGVLAAGPVRTGPSPWAVPDVAPLRGGQLPAPHASAPPATPAPYAGAISSTVPKLLLVVAVLAAIVLGFLLWRMLVRRVSRQVALPPDLALQTIEEPVFDRDPEPDPAPAVARGIARALQVLDEPREPHDAIVEAWLGLQEAAADSGVRRRAAETPAEYTTRIIGRIGADSDATETLLRLYQDVRFGGHPVDSDDVATARSCLLRLRESWHAAGAR